MERVSHFFSNINTNAPGFLKGFTAFGAGAWLGFLNVDFNDYVWLVPMKLIASFLVAFAGGSGTAAANVMYRKIKKKKDEENN